ncbi:MAG: hypothetical protein ABEK36_02690 [Candidatus Aenigmatarchaeota archaeon]
MKSTSYGIKGTGSSRFVIVAPHAAGDDLRTKELALNISKHLDAFTVINEEYVKNTNSNSRKKPDKVEDFNKLEYSVEKSKYVWENKHPHMKEFYEHIEESCKNARRFGDGKSITIFIHGMKDNEECIGIDIGFGAKYRKGELVKCDKCMGKPRAKAEDVVGIKETLGKNLSDYYGLKASIGEFYAAWSIENGVQYYNNFPGKSLQLEISYSLRKPGNIEHTSELIAEAMRKHFCV